MKEHSNEYKLEVGQRHGRLVAIQKIEDGKSRCQWLFQCDCGNERIMSACWFYRLKSCGCLNEENRHKPHWKTHGWTETKLYNKWVAMKNRCYNPNFFVTTLTEEEV